MQFDLTPELIDQILFAMENQEVEFIVEADTSLVVPFDQLSEDNFEPNRHYSIPEWGPNDGFRTMEAFCAQLHNPVYRERLFGILSSGRKVFRRFKEVLRERPELEQRYRQFKRQTMQRVISVWYNDLRDTWGLERKATESVFSDELLYSELSIVGPDRIFAAESYLSHAERHAWRSMAEDSGEHTMLRARRIRNLFCGLNDSSETEDVVEAAMSMPGVLLYGQSPEGETAGCIWICLSRSDTAELGLIFVEPEYRGIGLAEKLIEKAIAELRGKYPECLRLHVHIAGKACLLLDYLERSGALLKSAAFSYDLR
ncbi:GNAT family N-acetyltransferase [Spirochaeta dissipatitropha]